jgi:hypothetical protein
MHLSAPTNSARSISANRFLTTSVEPHRGTIICRNGTTSHFSANHVTIIELEPGCHAETATHVVTATLDIPVEVKTVAYAWYRDPRTLIHDLELGIYEGLRDIHELKDVPTEASDAIAWTKAKQDYQQHKHTSYGTTLALIIVVVVIIIGAGIGIFCCFRYRTQLANSLLTLQDSLHVRNLVPTAPQVAYNPAFIMGGQRQSLPDLSTDHFTIINHPNQNQRISIPRTA